MASKFIPPPDQINTISSKKTKKSFSNLSKQSIFHEIKRNIKDSFTTDAFEQVGQLNAIVLEVIDTDCTKMLWKNPMMSWAFHERNVIPDYIEVRYRVPEIHAHLPEPTWAGDYKAINRHPKAIMKKDKGTPEVGDIITLDFKDKNNFSQAMVIESFNTNEGANPGGTCSAAAAFGSGTPSFNTAPATGDSQDSKKEEYSATNDRAEESFDVGIDYSLPKKELKNIKLYNESKKSIYFISIDNLNTMPEFLNLDKTIEILASKHVLSLCFSIAEGERMFSDINRLSKLIDILNENNIDVGLSIKHVTDPEIFEKAYNTMTDLVRVSKFDYIIDYLPLLTEAKFLSRDQTYASFTASIGIDYFLIIDVDTFDPDESSAGQPWERYINDSHASKVFAAAHSYDYYDKGNDSVFTEFINNVSSNGNWSGISKLRTMYYLDGNNFIKIPGGDQECLYGERTVGILEEDWVSPTNSNAPFTSGAWSRDKVNNYMWTNYESLDVAKMDWINTKMNITSDQLQNLLNSSNDITKSNKSNITDVVGQPVTRTIEEPAFNQSGSTQDATETPPPPEPSASPGASCTPFPGGPSPFGGSNAGAAGGGAPVSPPSYRFDSIENYQNLGWTANNSAAINDVIFEFMERFSAAVYRRLPANSPSFTGSVPKKIRLTSTARTAQRQVELMWDKIDNQGDAGVWEVYGSKRTWVREVVKGYHQSPQDKAYPTSLVQANIDAGKAKGHLTGRGIDVHTFSHLVAEGLQGHGASKATMMSSKFVKAIVAAARECGGSPLVEHYQQHVHITIL